MKSRPLQLRSPDRTNGSGDDSLQLPLPAIPESYVSITQRETTLRDYWLILIKRRWTIIAFASVILILTTIFTFKTTPIYDAVARIAINRENSDALPFKDNANASGDLDYTVDLETQVRILRSDNLAMQVIRKLGLDRDPKFAGVSKPEATVNEPATTPGA